MANEFSYQSFYWADYMADTEHLTTIQHGAYLLLISSYWRSGRPLPSDDESLANITRLGADGWQEHKAVILRFFHREGEFLHHKKIDNGLADARAKSEKNRRAALAKGGAGKVLRPRFAKKADPDAPF